jgi:peroxiredoxin Q/BCP
MGYSGMRAILVTIFIITQMAAKAQIAVGERIPSFELLDQNGSVFKSDDYLGKPLVIFFYPKDHTPGCTAEACRFRDFEYDFAEVGAVVVGVNSGSVTEHKGFADKYNLNFPVLSDPGHQVRKSFGSPGVLFNMVADRVTYVTDKDHKVAYIFKSMTKAADHVDESLNFLKELK